MSRSASEGPLMAKTPDAGSSGQAGRYFDPRASARGPALSSHRSRCAAGRSILARTGRWCTTAATARPQARFPISLSSTGTYAHPDGSARDLNRVWPDTDQPPPLTETSFGPDELRRFRYPYTRERIWRRARMARSEKPTQGGDGLACQHLIGSAQPGGVPTGPRASPRRPLHLLESRRATLRPDRAPDAIHRESLQ